MKIEIHRNSCAFSLVEVLAAVAIIGIITFLALPNIVQVKEDSERTLAVARAEALNMSMASYIQANGIAVATDTWNALPANDSDARYQLIRPYLAFAPSGLGDYMPSGYTVSLPNSISTLVKATVTGPNAQPVAY
jgi:prepilin-type N-terminal cleavage/methylation domain-containing protein